MKMDTSRRVRVDDSTVCSETEHCSSGAGGELSYISVLYLDVAGAYSKWALNISGPNSDWAWQLGFELGLDGVDSNWTQGLVGLFPSFWLIFQNCPWYVSAFFWFC
jgi:hypothetical protein